MKIELNRTAKLLVDQICHDANLNRISVTSLSTGARILDCGVHTIGGLRVGLAMAEVAMAGLGQVQIVPGIVDRRPIPVVQVSTDHPLACCLASQYAGWQVSHDEFFAMGSGPMRAARVKDIEEIYARIGWTEKAERVVGVLEGRNLPSEPIVASLAEACQVEPGAVDLLIAPTASLAGGVQVVARSVETAMHKLGELEFDLDRVISGYGTAPLPPVAAHDLDAIGRTNDAILYGARVTLFVRGDDASLIEIGTRLPSSNSSDYGEPFGSLFARYGYDFYRVDKNLFSPAEIVLQNVETGFARKFGQTAEDILARSYFA